MKKTSVKPAKVKKAELPKKVKSKKITCPQCNNNLSRGLNIGFLMGFATGAMIVAVIDYLDDKRKEMRRIEKGSDADYYYTVE